MTSFQATLVNTGFGQLILRDSLGKVAQKWTLSNPKCVIGSGTNCNVSCQLPGIVDHHVLMVIGAKQVFIRAMASGLTRNGQNVSEMVISGNESEFAFEIAGHHFQFARDGVATPVAKDFVQEPVRTAANAPATQSSAPASQPKLAQDPVVVPEAVAASNTLALAPSRLKFTVVRALEKNRQAGLNETSIVDTGLSSNRPAWVEAIVREALRPVEERLDDLNGPLQNIERRLRRQRARLRKSRKQANINGDATTIAKPNFVPVLAPELIQSQSAIEKYILEQSAQLEIVTHSVGQIVARLTDVDRQLSTNQTERQQLSEQYQQSNQQIAALQSEMSQLFHGLQKQLVESIASPDDSQARLWQSNIEAQLAELQATLLALDDIKSTLQAALEHNRTLKNDWEVQQQKIGQLVAESTQKAVTCALAQSNNDSDTLAQVVGERVCDSLREQLGTRFTNEVAQQLSDSLNNDFALPLSSQLSSQLTDQFANQFSNQFTSDIVRQLASAIPAAEQQPGPNEIVEALRGTLTELLAPLATTLQSGIQDAIKQAVDQSVQQSVQLSVQQTIAPMIEAATAAQARAAVVLPVQEVPTHRPSVDLPIIETNLDVQPVARLPMPAEEPSAETLANEPDYAQDLQADQGYVDASQGFDSQPYSPPGFSATTLDASVYDSQPAAPVQDSQAYQPQAYDSQAHEPQAYDSQAYEPQAYQPQAYDSQAYEPQAYDSQAYEPQTYDSQAYEPQAYDSQAYEPQAYDSQAYQPQAYDSQAYEPQAYDSQAYQPQVYDSQTYEPEQAADQLGNSEVYDSQAYAAPGDSQSYSVRSDVASESVSDVHQELPSWWSEDPVAAERESTIKPISADHDGEYAPAGDAEDSESYREMTNYDSTSLPVGSQESEDAEPHAQSAFSAEQLELGANDNASIERGYKDDNYDSVPYSELVNRKRAPDERDEVPSEEYEPLTEFPSGFAPYVEQESALVPMGASDYPGERYSEYPSEEVADIAQPEHMTQSAPIADNPTVPASQAQAGEEGDESVEDYMRRLLARMRGVSESEVSLPGAESAKPASVPSTAPKDLSAVQSPVATATTEPEQISEAWTEPFDPEKYVPRGTAPEKNRDLNAMRELANTSARSAIQVSARRRQGSAILIKAAIALVGLVAGIALVWINGARINIAFIATLASFMVAVIWGYDAVTSIRPLLQSNRQSNAQKRKTETPAN